MVTKSASTVVRIIFFGVLDLCTLRAGGVLGVSTAICFLGVSTALALEDHVELARSAMSLSWIVSCGGGRCSTLGRTPLRSSEAFGLGGEVPGDAGPSAVSALLSASATTAASRPSPHAAMPRRAESPERAVPSRAGQAPAA